MTDNDLLPLFVYDLIAAVEKYEEEHGDRSTCLHTALYRVPERQRDMARAIAAYRRTYPFATEVPS